MKILFLLPVLSDSNYQKRIENFLRSGVQCSVVGFERHHYQGKPWPIEVHSLGLIEHGKYFKRVWTLLISAISLRKKIKNHEYIYAFNLDILFLAWFSSIFSKSRPNFVYEIFDIHPILYKKSIYSILFRKIERFLIRKVKVVVVASPHYIEGYFHEVQKLHSATYHVIENKLNSFDISQNPDNSLSKKPSDEPIIIGFFGMIRCVISLNFLYDFLQKNNGRFRLSIRGLFMVPDDKKQMILKSNFSEYCGPYIYPDDLNDMYSKVDLIWAAQKLGEAHTRFSRTNRFYQSCFFKKPMITQAGTKDSEIVMENNLGITIDLDKPVESMDLISKIDRSDFKKWHGNLNAVPENVYLITTEYKELIEKIKS